MSKAFEWKQRNLYYLARVGPWLYQVDTSSQPAIYAMALGLLANDDEKHFDTIEEAKAWCDSHYRDWYNTLPTPIPEATK